MNNMNGENSIKEDLFNLNIPTFTKSDSILNVPGQFLFQVGEDDEVKIGKSTLINKKKIEEIIEAIRNVFKNISDNLSKYFINFDYNYYDGICKKLRSFVASKTLRFPGLQVINLSKDHIEIFSKISERILICEKSDGVRYLLIHFTNGYVLFVGRNLEFYLVNLKVNLPSSKSENNFKNKNIKDWEIENFLDGELILDKSKLSKEEIIKLINHSPNHNFVKLNENFYELKFLIFDAIIINRENIGHLKFRDRLKKLSEFFFYKDNKKKFMMKFGNFIEESILELMNKNFNNNSGEKNPKFSIEIFMKDYFTFDKIENLYNNVSKKLSHENDGVILNLDDYPYYSGQSTEIYKWKPANLNTIDFEITQYRIKDKILFLLNVNETRNKLLPVSILFFENEEEKEKFKLEFEEMGVSGKSVIVECFYNFNFNTNETKNYHLLCDQGIIKKSETREGLTNLSDYSHDFYEKHSKRVEKKYIEFGAWQFMRFRKDKLLGNSLNTFISVWKTIIENVQMNDIMIKIKENNTKQNHINLDNNLVLATHLKRSLNSFKMSPGLFDDDLPVTNINKEIHSDEFLKQKRHKENPIIDEIVNKFEIKNINEVIISEESIKKNKNSQLNNSAPVDKKEFKKIKEKEKKETKIQHSNQMLDFAFDDKKNIPQTKNKISDSNFNKTHNVVSVSKIHIEEEKISPFIKNNYINSLLNDDESIGDDSSSQD